MYRITNMFRINVFYGTFLFKRLILLVSMVLFINLLSPIITSIYGKNLDITTISLFSIIITSIGVLQILIRKVRVKYITYCIITSDIILIIGLLLYISNLITDMMLIFILLTSSGLESLIGASYGNKITNMLSKTYPEHYEEFLYSKGALTAISSLLGLSITAATSHLGGIKITMGFIVIMSFICIMLEFKQMKELIKMENELLKIKYT